MRLAALTPALLLLASCGSDSAPTPTPTPTPTPIPSGPNTPPAFTSPATASMVENSTAAALQVLATDAQSDPITLAITGGADAALFTLDVTGRLAFRTSPNFDAPADANLDNGYDLIITASDGRASATQDVRITVTNSREGIAVRRVATGLSQPMQVYKDDENADRLYVAERGGRIYALTVSTGARTLLATLPSLSTDGERGLIGFAVGRAGPGTAASTPALYILATAPDGTINLHWYVRALDGSFAPSAVQPILLSIPHAEFSNHNGGWIDFGPGGDGPTADLYIGMGDGGGSGDPNNRAQDPNSRLGKILRLSRAADPYAGASPAFWIPSPRNPFAGGGGDRAIYALGLRNPFRGAVEGNMLIVADVGQGAIEEVNLIPTDATGPNLGWPYLEGTQSFRGTAPAGLLAPKLQYRHGTGPFQGRSITGGRVYRGPITELNGAYLFADFVSKHIWSVPYDRLLAGPLLDGTGFEQRDADFAPDAGTLDQIVAFGTDRAGSIFIVDLDGEIFQLVAG